MSSERRAIDDPTWIRAMAHPLRWRILDILRGSDEPLTATQISEQVGESPANCSFHLRTLAKYGFIEEAGGGTGRSRPWRACDIAAEVIDDPDAEPIPGQQELADIIRARAFKTIEDWQQHRTHPYDAQWRRAAMEAEWGLPLTVEEIAEIQAEIKKLIGRYADRKVAPPGAVASKVYAWVFPVGDPAKPTTGEHKERGSTKLHARGRRA